MKRFSIAIVFVCAASLASAARAQGDSPAGADVDLAKAHFNTGQIDYDKGLYSDAAHEFEEAYRLSGRAPLLYNVGKSYDGASDFARALDAYRRFLAAAPDSSDRAAVDKRVQLLETLVGKVTLTGAVPGSSVTLDGNGAGKTPLEALLVNPGRHTVELTHEGYANFKSAIDVPVGGATTLEAKQLELVKVVRVEVQAQRDRTPVYKKWWLWTAVGGAVVVAGVITAVVLTTGKSSPGGLDVQLPTVR